MKKLIILFIFLTFFSCKKNKSADPQPTIQDASFAFQEFKVEGVSQENISFVDRIIFVRLPLDYAHGKIILPSVKMNKGFNLETDISKGIRYESKDFSLHVSSEKYGDQSFGICVIPAVPLDVEGDTAQYEVTITRDTRVQIPMENIGSVPFVDELGNFHYFPTVSMKSKRSGEVFEIVSAMFTSDGSASDKIWIDIPKTTPADVFDVTIKWAGKVLDRPGLIKVKHGKPEIDQVGGLFVAGSPLYTISGFNLDPDHTYELQLENDFVSAVKIALVRKDFNTLVLNMPDNIKPGNYNAKIFIDSKEYQPLSYPYPPYANFNFMTAEKQPFLRILSRPSLLKTGVCYFYESTNVLHKSENIVADIPYGYANETTTVSLRIRNLGTGQEYILPSTGSRETVLCWGPTFSQFPIPASVPKGSYEVYAIVGNDLKDPKQTSEKLGQIVTIQ
ncbi:MAG: hypothetical protein ABIN80_25170 [Dyadobacter sp.]|uniref:hypothetical protein n=1 Tax=Dyadobacter sp. TaxID=1914288 RepID=UPI00326359BA